MVKTLAAQAVTSINPIQFVWKEGVLTNILVQCEVSYGELGLNHSVDILPDLTPTQVTKAKSIYNAIRAKIEAEFLGD